MARWWEIVVPAAGALIAGLSGAWLQAQSSVKVLKQQGQAELDRLVAAQRHEDERRWIETRKSIYVEYLSIYEEWAKSQRRWFSQPLTLPTGTALDSDRPTPRFDYAGALQKMNTLNAEMELLASPTTKQAADQLFTVLFANQILKVAGDLPTTPKVLGPVEDALKALKASMRSDLGVVLPGEDAGDPGDG
ncbi:hypothetical protein ACIA3K_10595 [Micromonospora sp. NPDC051543]|uniref:hypothetical protein n=1 Tax=Micromonospora sp. NPDC051543 TaxID=3364287 RepID=UPI0037B6E29A